MKWVKAIIPVIIILVVVAIAFTLVYQAHNTF